MFERKFLIERCVAIAVAAAAAACSDAASPGHENHENVSVGSTHVGIEWETFRASARPAIKGGLVVEGDLTFRDEQHLRQYWEKYRAPRRGDALTVFTRTGANGIVVDDIWAFPTNFALTYCIGTGFTAAQNTQLVPAIEAAGRAWSQIVGVQFERVTVTGTCNASNNTVVFDVQRAAGSDYFAEAFIPSESRSARTLWVYDGAFTTTEGGRTLTGIMTHELGHAIGFQHEHVWLSPRPDNCSDPRGTVRAVTAYDQLSVMHYPQCRTPPGGGYNVSQLDYEGAVTLYGLAPALIATVPM